MSPQLNGGTRTVAFWARRAAALTLLVVTGTVIAAPAASPVSVAVTQNSPGRIALEYALGGFDRATVDIQGVSHTLIVYPREAPLLRRGAPELPHVARSVLIADTGGVSAAVTDAIYYDIPDIDIAPSKGNLSRTVDPQTVPYSFDDTVYKADAFYPGDLVRLDEPYILRDHRGVTVNVYPFQYNPVRRVLRVYTTMSVEITPTGVRGGNELLSRPAQNPSLAFEDIYASHFLNYEPQLRYAPLNEEGRMVIICHDAWLTNVQPLVTHKNSIGISTTAVGVSTVGTTAAAIKTYIQNQYNQGNLAFVLLVGDSAQVATPTVSTSQGSGAGDPTYAQVAGGDQYPDILVGRFSAESAANVDTQVLRTIEYETQSATQQAWYHRGIGVASSEGSGIGDDGEADYTHIDNIRTVLLGAGYTLVDQVYATNGGTAGMITTGLNAGRGVINYCGHGSDTAWTTTGFSNTHVNALTNDNLLPFIFSVACVNGNFTRTSGPCFAEAWLRATHNGEPIGAVATYMSSINQSWAPPMQAQDTFATLISAQTYHSYGAICYAGSCAMMDQYGSGAGGGGTEMFITWHIFGDPSLRVIGVAAPPHGMEVTPASELQAAGPRGGPFTPNSVSYLLRNVGTDPIAYTAAKTVNWITLSSTAGTIPGGETVTVTASINAHADTLNNGDYSDAIQFTNVTAHEGDTSRNVHLTVGVSAAIYSWNLDADPGWVTTGPWAYGTPTGAGSHNRDPAAGHTGTHVYGYNLAGDYTNGIDAALYLTTTAIDCTYLTETHLKFWRWLGVESATFDHATVEVSNDGQAWTTVWQNGTTNVADTSWTQQSYDISAIADGHAAVFIRWSIGPTDTGITYPGWNIDDVEIWALDNSPLPPAGACCLADGSCNLTAPAACGGTYQGDATVCDPNPCPPPICRGDANCDKSITWRDIDFFVASMNSNEPAWTAKFLPGTPTCGFANCDVNGDGAVTWRDIDGFVGKMNTACP